MSGTCKIIRKKLSLRRESFNICYVSIFCVDVPKAMSNLLKKQNWVLRGWFSFQGHLKVSTLKATISS